MFGINEAADPYRAGPDCLKRSYAFRLGGDGTGTARGTNLRMHF